jgi:hypothetical protein
MKLPHIQLYHGDWLKDPISACSIAAQGLWLRLMFIMQDSVPRGFLCVPDDRFLLEFCFSKDASKLESLLEPFIAKRAGIDMPEYGVLMKELWSARVPSKTENGVIYSRRMVRDEELRKVRADAGSKGGRARLLKQNGRFALANNQANPDNDNGTDIDTDIHSTSNIARDRPKSPALVDLSEFRRVQNKLASLYGRNPSAPWSYLEESNFRGLINSRPDFEREIEEISDAIKGKVKFLATDLGNLLDKWTANLDRARKSPRKGDSNI